MNFMNHKKQLNWDEFEQFFSNFNPFTHNNHFPKGNDYFHVKTNEGENEYIIEIPLPYDSDLENIRYKVCSKEESCTLKVVVGKK